MEQKIDMLIELYPELDDLFDELDITIEEVISILLKGGHVKLPDYLDYGDDGFRSEE